MPIININTKIKSPIHVVFDYARNIDLHQLSTAQTNEKAIAGKTSGLINLGETVTWRAKHFGIYQNLTSKITEMNYPIYFVDEMTKGIFKSIRHEHYFETVGGQTVMKDIMKFESPCGILGRIFNKLVLTNYLTRLLIERNKVIKTHAENH